MALSVFDDQKSPPTEADLKTALGRSHTHWSQLIGWLEESYEPVTCDWQFTGAKWGWNLKVQRPKRAIVYLTPCAKHFLAGFALGEKAVKLALAEELPDEIREAIRSAPKYAEGRGVRIEVRNARQREGVKKLVGAKMAP